MGGRIGAARGEVGGWGMVFFIFNFILLYLLCYIIDILNVLNYLKVNEFLLIFGPWSVRSTLSHHLGQGGIVGHFDFREVK